MDIRILRDEYKESVAWVYRSVPLHSASRAAALAAECAGRQGAFVAMHDRLFAGSDSIGIRAWSSYAAESGIQDTATFVRCLQGASADSAILRDSLAAAALGIRGTPTFLINERQLAGNKGIAALRDAVRRALPEQPWYTRVARKIVSFR